MKTLNPANFLLFVMLLFSAINLNAQKDSTKSKIDSIYIITTIDGGEFVGIIISQDEREVLIETKDKGRVIIPRYQIEKMRTVEEGEISATGNYIPAEVFSTRYFLTTNGLPIKKGESYILWNLWGPDFQFGVLDNLSLGVITSWMAYPIIGTAKYSIPLARNVNLALGALVGTTTWGWNEFHFGMALPFASLTFGDRTKNITFSGGYGVIWFEESVGSSLFSVAGMAKVGKKVTFVFDSFIGPPSSDSGNVFMLIMPGFRLQTQSKSAFQFGFTGIVADGSVLPLPIPSVQWFRKL